MRANKFTTPLAVLVCLGALLYLWRQVSHPSVNLKPSAAAGEVVAEEVGRLLGGKGKVILLSREVSKTEPDASAQLVASFTAALPHRTSLNLAATEWTPRPPAGVMDFGAVSPEQFLAALEKNPGANGLVVFAGLPPWSPALAEKLSARSLKLVAVCGYGPNVRRWLESKALTLAVVPRFDDPPAGTAAPKTAKDWFEREYQLVTPESVGLLPY